MAHHQTYTERQTRKVQFQSMNIHRHFCSVCMYLRSPYIYIAFQHFIQLSLVRSLAWACPFFFCARQSHIHRDSRSCTNPQMKQNKNTQRVRENRGMWCHSRKSCLCSVLFCSVTKIYFWHFKTYLVNVFGNAPRQLNWNNRKNAIDILSQHTTRCLFSMSVYLTCTFATTTASTLIAVTATLFFFICAPIRTNKCNIALCISACNGFRTAAYRCWYSFFYCCCFRRVVIYCAKIINYSVCVSEAHRH